MTPDASKRSRVGCFWAVPLGCLAFLGGAALVAILLLPVAGGMVVSDTLEERFHRRYLGWLDLDDTHLPSVHGEQHGTVLLVDPDEELVLEATYRAPRLPILSEPTSWGPVELDVTTFAVRVDAQGETSLERTFTLRDPEARQPLRVQIQAEDDLEEVTLRLNIRRLTWTDERRPGWTMVLEDVRAVGRLRSLGEADLQLTGQGRVASAASESTMRAEEPTLAFELVVEDAIALLRGESSGSWRLRVVAPRIASEDLDGLLGTGSGIAEQFGAKLSGASVVLSSSATGPASVAVSVGQQHCEVLGPRSAPRVVEKP